MQDLKDIVYMQDIAEMKKEHAEEVQQLYNLFHITNMQRRIPKNFCMNLLTDISLKNGIITALITGSFTNGENYEEKKL